MVDKELNRKLLLEGFAYIPLGVWDLQGNWYPNELLKMTPEQQRKHNEAIGYQCSVCNGLKSWLDMHLDKTD